MKIDSVPWFTLLAAVSLAPAAPDPATILARWSFEKESPAASHPPGGPTARIEGAPVVDGHRGSALSFSDWSVTDWLKPDPAGATRVSVPHASAPEQLNPAPPFRVSAWIYPVADPVYYGGVVEKGEGLEASYRIVILRGLRIGASLGASGISLRSPEPVSLNEWHEVALRVEASRVSLHVDGREVAASPLSAPPILESTAPLVIGERFSGRIDEVEISR